MNEFHALDTHNREVFYRIAEHWKITPNELWNLFKNEYAKVIVHSFIRSVWHEFFTVDRVLTNVIWFIHACEENPYQTHCSKCKMINLHFDDVGFYSEDGINSVCTECYDSNTSTGDR